MRRLDERRRRWSRPQCSNRRFCGEGFVGRAYGADWPWTDAQRPGAVDRQLSSPWPRALAS